MESIQELENLAALAAELSQRAADLADAEAARAENGTDGWRCTGEIRGDRIYVSVWHGRRLVTRGFSFIAPEKAGKDVGMAQCFSYAAHMAFKNAQQREGLSDVE